MENTTQKREKLITSDRVYHSIKWDNSYDVRKCEIAYYDGVRAATLKENGIQEDYTIIPFSQWVPIDKGGDIPWHKIYKFIYDGKILWDRTNRFYNPELRENKNKSNVMLLRFDKEKNKWISENPELIWKNCDNKYIPSTCKILSWNILFDKYETDSTQIKHQFKTRLTHILDCIENANPDIIALQEITTTMLFDQILKHEKSNILEDYYITDSKYANYGQITLTKYAPVSQNLISLCGKKTYLQMTFLDSDDNRIEFCNIHLTSNKQKGSETKRSLQLKTILTNLEMCNHCIIAGDFNSQRDIIIDNSNILLVKNKMLLDSWNLINNGNIGYTYDTFNNPLAKLHSHNAIPGRFDRILFTQNSFKVRETVIVGNNDVNGVWLSDHYGIMTTLINSSIEINVLDNPEYLETSSLSLSLSTPTLPGIALAYIVDIKYWNFINQYRERHDSRYKIWCPHVTLYTKYINLENHYDIRSRIVQILNENTHKIIFDEVCVFDHGTSYTVVLTPSKEFINKLKIIKGQLDLLIGRSDSCDYVPHISLGNFKSMTSASSLANKVKEEMKNNKTRIIVKTNQVSLLMKDQTQYEVIDRFNYDSIKSKSVLKFIKKIVESVLGQGSTIHLCGSRAFCYNDTDFDIVVTYDHMSEEMFYKKCLATLKYSPYVAYVEKIQSKIETINIEMFNSVEINLIYTQTTNNYIKNPLIKNMIDIPNAVLGLVASNGGKINDFCKKYVIIRKISGYKKLVGSKYGYLNGISFLILTLKLYLDKLKSQKKCVPNEEFVKLFFEKYANYEWKTQIISTLPLDIDLSIQSNYCDRFLMIRDILPPYENVNRTLVSCCWKITQETFKACHENFSESYLKKTRILRDNCVAIKICGKVKKHMIEYKRGISFQIWKIAKDFVDIDPDTEWRYDEENSYYEYRIGINNTNESISLINNINRIIAGCKNYDDVKVFAFYDYN